MEILTTVTASQLRARTAKLKSCEPVVVELEALDREGNQHTVLVNIVDYRIEKVPAGEDDSGKPLFTSRLVLITGGYHA